MTIEAYRQAFRNLNVNRRDGHASPHKVCLLLAVIDLIESGDITDNRFNFDDVLLESYQGQFDRLQTNLDQPNPHLPYYHLKSSGFWHHKIIPSKETMYDSLNQSISQSRVRDSIDYVYLDPELFELLQYSTTRELLRSELYENVDLVLQEDYQGGREGWSQLECELIACDYINMLLKELSGEKYIKSHHRKNLLPFLNERSDGSVEYKLQNISAILIELGFPYIQGYKPAFNYQRLLFDVVLAHVNNRFEQVESKSIDMMVDAPERHVSQDWQGILEDAPQVDISKEIQKSRTYQTRIYNYSEREAQNRRLGEKGEKFVLDFERQRLDSLGRSDLASQVEWTSKTKGDGAGYDIRSFDEKNEEELFIEVKTTNSGKYQPFYITDNEIAFSEENTEHFSLYRVFEFRKKPRLFKLKGNINQYVYLTPKQYQASF